jgi:GR25 family glycosyltransferase involved in LPS biosynthesis
MLNNYLDNIDIIYWINLERSVNRKKNMENILKDINIPNKRFNAVDGKELNDKEIYSNFINTKDFNRSKIEYACLLSHLKTIKEFANSDYNTALILEDDVSMEYKKYWDKKISQIIKDAPKDWDIIQLNYASIIKLNELYTFNFNGNISCTSAYLINKNGANKLMNLINKENKFILLPNTIHTADNYIFYLLKTYTYKYPYFTYPTNNDSTIHPDHIWFHNYAKNVAFMSWNDKYNIQNNIKNIGINIVSSKNNIILFMIFIIIIYLIYLIYMSRINKKNYKYS